MRISKIGEECKDSKVARGQIFLQFCYQKQWCCTITSLSTQRSRADLNIHTAEDNKTRKNDSLHHKAVSQKQWRFKFK